MPPATGDDVTTAEEPASADDFLHLIRRAQEPAPAPADSGDGEQPPASEISATRKPVRRLPILAGAIVGAGLLVAATVFAVVYGLDDAHHRAVSAAERAATTAARQDAVYVSSYDYRSLDKAFDRVTDNATGSFKDDFAKTSQALEPTITKAKATAAGTVQDIAVQSGSTSTVVLLAFVDQTLTTAASTTPQTITNRLVITMTKQHGRWLMSNVVTV